MEFYKEITLNHLLSLIADNNTSEIFFKNQRNLYPLGRTEFSFKELRSTKFYIKEIKEKK